MLYITYANGAGPGGHWDGTLNEPCDNGQVWSFNTSTSAATNITPVTGRAYSGVCVDPANANRIVVSTINRWDFQFGNAWGDYVYLSTDGGSTWIQKLSSTSTLNTNGMDWVTGNAIHWAGSIEFDPLNTAKVRIISGNGLFTCDDINAAATTWKFDSKGIEETVALDAISIPGGNFISAVGDVWGAVYSDIYAYPAQKIMPTVICNTGVAYAANNTSKVVRVTDKIYYSTDQGATWTQSTSINGTYGKVALSADGNTILHCPEATTTYYSTNNGGTWTSTGVTNVDRAVPVADFVNTNKFYIYSRASGQLLVSTNKGVSFTASTSNPGQWGSQLIRAVPGNEGHVWVALYGSGLKYTTNNGTSWTTVSNITYCTAVGFGKTEPSATYPTIYIWGTIGGVDGIYRSIDQGVNWTRINDDAHEWGGPGNGNFVMGDMNVYGRVYMSTVGRGIVVGELSGPQPLTANAGTDVTICQGNSTTLSGSASEGTGGPYTYSWSPSTGLSSTSISNPVASPTSTTTYTLTANDGTSTATDQVVVTVNPLQSLPIAEGFESATFPSTGWTLSGNNSFTRNTSCTAATGSGSIVASTFGNSTLGNTYELTTPLLSFPSATSTTLSFKYATMFYDQGGTNNDRYDNLSVWISTTCGGTYSKIWDQSTGGVTSTIASSAGDNSVFCPSNSANDWDAESVDLSAYDGGTIGNGVQLKFVVTNGHGTNVYLDDINISNVGAVSTSITLLNFNAVKNGSEVDIKWQTATEINNDYFTVEKSLPAGQAGKNGIDFTTVDIVDGAGNSQSILNYQTTDRFPYNGISYYRLKQVDYDGTVSYSEIVAVNFNDHKNITVYPNPGTGIFNIEGLGTESEITVDNPLGQTILIKRTFSDSSEIDLRDQLSGVYYIKINNGDSSVCTKIIIHR
jgi:hypothetical protein